jgi:hypothetical protein
VRAVLQQQVDELRARQVSWDAIGKALGHLAPSGVGALLLARFSQTICAIERGFATPLLGILRTSLGVASGDAGSAESCRGLRVQRRRGVPVGLRVMPRWGDAMRHRVSGGRSASVWRGRKASGGKSPADRRRAA